MGMSNAGTSSAGQSFMSTLVARMPYTYKVIQNAIEANPKYDAFKQLTSKKEAIISNQSIFQRTTDGGAGAMMMDRRYHDIMYADVDTDKIRRIMDYRKMAAYAELADCIEEISDEAIVKDDQGEIVKMIIKGGFERSIVDKLKKEWTNFIDLYDLENKGWEYIRQFLVEGELFFENVISETRPDFGIVGVIRLPPELINAIYSNIQNHELKGFMLRKPIVNPRQTVSNQTHEETIILDGNQVTYMHSGLWNEDRTIRLPYIENSRRAYKQLSLVEDSIIIYRLVRAPERLVFKVDVGNMPVPKAEEYVKKLMQQYWTRKNFDSSKGAVSNTYDPQSMLDAYWFTKRGQSEGTTVEQLPGGANLGQLDDLMYFVKKLYKSLKVPATRLDANDPFKDGTEITREELRFARFIIRLQAQLAQGLKRSFINHLKLREKTDSTKSIWEQLNLSESSFGITFNPPSYFATMREQQIFDLKSNNFSKLTASQLISQSFAQKYYLGLNDKQMAENREWLRKDASLSWEIQNITTNGPDFRQQMSASIELDKIAGGAAVGGLPAGGSELPGGGELPPDFGTAPEVSNQPAQPVAAPQEAPAQ